MAFGEIGAWDQVLHGAERRSALSQLGDEVKAVKVGTRETNTKVVSRTILWQHPKEKSLVSQRQLVGRII